MNIMIVSATDYAAFSAKLSKTTYEKSEKSRDYDISLDMPIALRKGTGSYTKYPVYRFLFYSNLSSKFKAFTVSLDTAIIPKNIHMAMEILEWKNVVEEMGALEKNNTWDFVLFLKGINSWVQVGVHSEP